MRVLNIIKKAIELYNVHPLTRVTYSLSEFGAVILISHLQFASLFSAPLFELSMDGIVLYAISFTNLAVAWNYTALSLYPFLVATFIYYVTFIACEALYTLMHSSHSRRHFHHTQMMLSYAYLIQRYLLLTPTLTACAFYFDSQNTSAKTLSYVIFILAVSYNIVRANLKIYQPFTKAQLDQTRTLPECMDVVYTTIAACYCSIRVLFASDEYSKSVSYINISFLVVSFLHLGYIVAYPSFKDERLQKIDVLGHVVRLYPQVVLIMKANSSFFIPWLLLTLLLAKVSLNIRNGVIKYRIQKLSQNDIIKDPSSLEQSLQALLSRFNATHKSSHHIFELLEPLLNHERVFAQQREDCSKSLLQDQLHESLVDYIDQKHMLHIRSADVKKKSFHIYISIVLFSLTESLKATKAVYLICEAERLFAGKLNIKDAVALEILKRKNKDLLDVESSEALGFCFDDAISYLSLFQGCIDKAKAITKAQAKMVCCVSEPFCDLDSIKKQAATIHKERTQLKRTIDGMMETEAYHAETASLNYYTETVLLEQFSGGARGKYARRVAKDCRIDTKKIDKIAKFDIIDVVNIQPSSPFFYIIYDISQSSFGVINACSKSIPNILGLSNEGLMRLNLEDIFLKNFAIALQPLVSLIIDGKLSLPSKIWKQNYFKGAYRTIYEVKYVVEYAFISGELSGVCCGLKLENTSKIIFVSDQQEVVGFSKGLMDYLTHHNDGRADTAQELAGRMKDSKIGDFLPDVKHTDWSDYTEATEDQPQKGGLLYTYKVSTSLTQSVKGPKLARHKTATNLNLLKSYDITYIITPYRATATSLSYYKVVIQSIKEACPTFEERVSNFTTNKVLNDRCIPGISRYSSSHNYNNSTHSVSSSAKEESERAADVNEGLPENLSHFSSPRAQCTKTALAGVPLIYASQHSGAPYPKESSCDHKPAEVTEAEDQERGSGPGVSRFSELIIKDKKDSKKRRLHIATNIEFDMRKDEVACKPVLDDSSQMESKSLTRESARERARVVNEGGVSRNMSEKPSKQLRKMKELTTSSQTPKILLRGNIFGYLSTATLMLIVIISYVVMQNSMHRFSKFAEVAPFPTYLISTVKSFIVTAEVLLNYKQGLYPLESLASSIAASASIFASAIKIFLIKYETFLVNFKIEDLSSDFSPSDYDILLTLQGAINIPTNVSIYQASNIFLGIALDLNRTGYAKLTNDLYEVQWLRRYSTPLITAYENMRASLYSSFYSQYDSIIKILNVITTLGVVIWIVNIVLFIRMLRKMEGKEVHLLKQVLTIDVEQACDCLEGMMKEYKAQFGSELDLPEIRTKLSESKNAKNSKHHKAKRSAGGSTYSKKSRGYKKNTIGLPAILVGFFVCLAYIMTFYLTANLYYRSRVSDAVPFINSIDIQSGALYYPGWAGGLLMQMMNIYNNTSLYNEQLVDAAAIFSAYKSQTAKLQALIEDSSINLVSNRFASAALKSRYQNITSARVCDDLIGGLIYKMCTSSIGMAGSSYRGVLGFVYSYLLEMYDRMLSDPSYNTARSIIGDSRTIVWAMFGSMLNIVGLNNIELEGRNLAHVMEWLQHSLLYFIVVGVLMLVVFLVAVWRPLNHRVLMAFLDARRVYNVLPVGLIADNKSVISALKRI